MKSTTMEFEEIKRIWDSQNNEHVYAINEEALRRRIQSKRNTARRVVNGNEIGLFMIGLIAGTTILIRSIDNGAGIFSYLLAFTLYFTCGYVLWGRVRRIRDEKKFDNTILGDLNNAISNANFMIKLARTMVWWYMLPIGIVSLLVSLQKGTTIGKWLIVPGAIILAFLVIDWGLRRKYIPRKKELETLRRNLIKETDPV